ncbi:MAG: hypothetical protein KF819_23190 [Labilithrix sp.]|nr:hypothetical protein [Labilithrix sp.]
MIAAGALVALFGGCSSTESEFSTSDSFCTTKADTECKHLALSCGVGADACKSKRAQVCNAAAAAAGGQGRQYKPNSARPCIDKIDEIFKEKVILPEKEAEVVELCERVFSGSVAKNGPCETSLQCDGTMVCDKGVCADKAPTKLDEACNNPGQVCDKGTFCTLRGQSKFCVAKKAAGEICSAESPCVEDLRCVNTCVARVTVGNKCDRDDECAPEAPYCDASKKTCLPKYQAGTSACRDYGAL